MIFSIHSRESDAWRTPRTLYRGEHTTIRAAVEAALSSFEALRRANLSNAALADADLTCADLTYADLTLADLRNAKLSYTDLRHADLRSANLTGADLTGANLRYANIEGANFEGANLSQIKGLCNAVCPAKGAFTAYKKVMGAVLELEIPADAIRLTAFGSRKCRANKVKVVAAMPTLGRAAQPNYEAIRGDFFYVVGETVEVDLDTDARVECSNGIHFFITLAEAEDWACTGSPRDYVQAEGNRS